MKELSIEEKAKRYDEALTKAKNIVSSINVGLIGKDSFEAVFPELKDGEDARIRKALIEFFELQDDNTTYSFVSKKDILSWLEKQGEHKHIAEEVLIKAGLKPYKDGNQWCVLLGDNIQEGICGFGNTVEDALYAFLKDLIASQSEQKPVDKVRLKFKDGDWVTSDGESVFNITIDNNKYQLETLEGTSCHYSYEIIERRFRLWTIQDAKVGDMLIDEGNNMGIYKEIDDIYWDSYIYLGCDGKLRGFSIGGKHKQTDTHPATKEQRDLLFQKMKEAGYEWDAEKKELKKIE